MIPVPSDKRIFLVNKTKTSMTSAGMMEKNSPFQYKQPPLYNKHANFVCYYVWRLDKNKKTMIENNYSLS